jgi:hypothetical protein
MLGDNDFLSPADADYVSSASLFTSAADRGIFILLPCIARQDNRITQRRLRS